MQAEFIHLRVHSEYSLTDGLVRVGPLMEQVAELGMPAVAISDRCNFFGLIKAYKAAARHGLKLLVAADFELLHDDERRTQLSLYALDDQGYLCTIKTND